MQEPSLSGDLRPVVDVVDLHPSCNCQVQMEIWLKDKDSHNWFFLLTAWTVWSLNWMRTPGRRFWKLSSVTQLFICLVLDGH